MALATVSGIESDQGILQNERVIDIDRLCRN